MADEFNWDLTLEPVIEAATLAIEGMPDYLRAQAGHRPPDVLFRAWRKAFLDDWASYTKRRLDPRAVAMARKLAGDNADRIVFTQPLAVCQTKTNQPFQIRDMVYNTAPFWYAAYYDVAEAALAEEPVPSTL